MQSAVVEYAKRSQILLGGGMTICILLKPEFFFSLDQGGVSNYGAIPITIVPYTAALLGCAYYMAKSAQLLQGKTQQLIDTKRITLIVSLFFLLLLLSTYPYQFSLLLTYAHQIISIMATIILLLAGLWMYSHTPSRSRKKANYYMLALILGVVLGFITVIDIIRLLFASQILVAVGFGGLYVSLMKYVTKPVRHRSTTQHD